MASGVYHGYIETKADAIAAKTLGPKVLNSMIEMNKARLTYEEILWDMGYVSTIFITFYSAIVGIFQFVINFYYCSDAKVKAQLLANHLRAMVLHVPTKNRLAALYKVKNDMMTHKYDLPRNM